MAQAARVSTHWVNDLLTGLTAATGVGYVAAAYSISRWLTRATPGVSTPALDLSRADMPEARWETDVCTTADGLALAGWIVTPHAPRGTIALFHGLRANRAQTLVRIAFLLRAGWRCVAFDHRAHGESAGKLSSFGWFESRDVAAVANLVAARWPQEPSAALGISMGAAAVCFAAGRAPFQAFILESVYHDLASAFRQRVGCGYPSWFARFSRGVIWVTERRLGVSIAEVNPADHIHELAPRPILLITGSDDPHATPDDVARLFDRCSDPRELHLIAGAGHNDVDAVGGRRYEELVLGFLDRHLTP